MSHSESPPGWWLMLPLRSVVISDRMALSSIIPLGRSAHLNPFSNRSLHHFAGVVGPGMESCSAGKDGKEAIVVNNSD